MGLDIAGFGAIADMAKGLIDRFFPNKTEAQKAELAQAMLLLQGEIDALTTRNNAYLEAWGLKNKAKTVRYQGSLAKRQGGMTLLTSTLSAGAHAASGYSQMKGG